MNLINKITYIFYGTYKIKRNFLKKSPNINLDFVFPAKIVKSQFNIANHNKLNWIFSKRSNLIKTENFIQYENEVITLKELSKVEIINVATWFGLINYNILKFKHNKSYIYIGCQSDDLQKYFLNAKYSTFKNNNYIFVIVLIIINIFIIVK